MTASTIRLSVVACACALAALFALHDGSLVAQEPVVDQGAVADQTSAEAQAPAPPQFLTTPARLLALTQAASQQLNYIPGEVIVKFRQGVTPGQQTRALAALRSIPAADQLQWIADRTARISDPADPDSIGMAQNLARQPEVEYAHPNWLLHKQSVPNDTSYAARQWNMTLLDMPRAWDINPGGAGVTVAVIDTGLTSITATYPFKTWDGTAIVTAQMPFAINPDFDAARIAAGRDFVFWNGPVLDSDGHGTHVSGTVAQTTNNSLGYAGMAYGAKLMPLKVCLSFWDIQILQAEFGITGYPPLNAGGCPDSDVVAAIHYAADNGAKVINLSLGGTDPSPSFRDALNYATGRGVFVAMSAGNEFDDGNPTTYPASYGPQVAGAMAVGAVGRSSNRAAYSSTGTFVEIAAPGGDVADGGGNGVVWQMGISYVDYDPAVIIFPRFDRYGSVGYQGTSMASPHVAGLAALLMSQGVTKPAAVEALIAATARDLGAKGRDNDFGAGLIQPRAALRGFGVVR
ncbi:MAG: S8 family serine peptidase [Acidobacteria bacterium]|nr:S8 family serine peptidase [Acidobacteriota bacterium]